MSFVTNSQQGPPMPPTIETRVRDLEEDRHLLRMTLENINVDLGRGRERMKEIEGEVDAMEEAVDELRRQMPVLLLMADWMKAGVLGVLALVGIALVGLVLK